MPNAYRVLVLDDEEVWRTLISESLREEGFHVETASTPDECRERLRANFYHLLVLDISMVRGDYENDEGLSFLADLHKSGETNALAVIVVSGYGTPERVRDSFHTYGIADFVQKKKFDNFQFVEHARSILTTHIKINLNLKILWQGSTSAREACTDLIICGKRLKDETPSHPLLERVSLELEDLLYRLFYDANEIVVQPMQRGRSGTGVLRVQPFYATEGRPAVVKFGEVSRVEQEARNFQDHVRPFLDRSTFLEGSRRTPLLGGIRYSLLGVTDDFEDFGTFYRNHSEFEVRRVLDNLFLQTCSPWYASPGPLRPHDLNSEYQALLSLMPQKLEEARQKGLKAVQGKERLHFGSLGANREFANPISWIGNRSFVRSTYHCLTHGDFDPSNILVDRSGATWLIDFFRTGHGHILRDFAQLETTLRIVFLAPEEATLNERLHLEQALVGSRHLGDVKSHVEVFQSASPALAKCYSTVVHLRSLAAEKIRQNPRNDIDEYYIALVHFALNLMRFWNLDTVQREHALLSAALIAEQIHF